MDENIASIGHPSSLLFENPQAAWAVPLYRYRTGKARKEEKMMQFTPTEMATIYRQAADKRKQIQVFMDTNGQTADEVKKSLLEGGILGQQFPRERSPHNKAAGKPKETAAKEQPQEPGEQQQKAKEQVQQSGDLSTRLARLHKLEEALAAGMRTIEEAIKAMEDAAQEAGN